MTKDKLRCPFCGDVLEHEPDGEYSCLKCGCMVLPGDDRADPYADWFTAYKADVSRRPIKRTGGSSGRHRKKVSKPLVTERWRLE